MAAAVGSLTNLRTLSPAAVAAMPVARIMLMGVYAGTVITASATLPPR